MRPPLFLFSCPEVGVTGQFVIMQISKHDSVYYATVSKYLVTMLRIQKTGLEKSGSSVFF